MVHLGVRLIACAGGDLEELGEDYNPFLKDSSPPYSNLSPTPPAAPSGETSFLFTDDDPEGF